MVAVFPLNNMAAAVYALVSKICFTFFLFYVVFDAYFYIYFFIFVVYLLWVQYGPYIGPFFPWLFFLFTPTVPLCKNLFDVFNF